MVKTLSDFSSEASDVFPDNQMTATAKYAVVKEKSASLFSTLNTATGSDFKVPD